ncbi:OLC1v1017303C2 [Oldenlandia corymbosa var. corymbosa]|uniref:Protein DETOXIFICATION n=1 Tax=Oldenlandia corymbosa var. corymbosa TaxID=529605 RepID=A0AAV1E942_OLDCO|nr:OLC1v1017303C2 [Oldenlandia corymbosa var. corymbosa]
MEETLTINLLQGKKINEDEEDGDLKARILVETKKLWQLLGPAIIYRISNYSMSVVTDSFAGHLGEVELASMSIAEAVIVAFNFGLLLGMATALETLCGQAYGAKRYNMLGIYLQRSWIVLGLASILLLPLYIYATPILVLFGQTKEVAELAGKLSIWFIPIHLAFPFSCSLQRFLMSQCKIKIVALISTTTLGFHVLITWLFVYKLELGVVGAAVALDISWWISCFAMLIYALGGWCPLTWDGFSMEAFSELKEFLQLSSAAGVMLCLEFWYYRVLILMTGNLKNATIAVGALSVCLSINGWELMIPFAFLAATGVRVSNELGAGNAKAAKFAAKVSLAQSVLIGILFCILVMIFHNKLALIFSSSIEIIKAVDQISYLLAFTILLNSVKPVLSGVAIGSGWQSLVAYVNLGSYYVIGIPLGIFMGWVLNFGVEVNNSCLIGLFILFFFFPFVR